MAIKLTRSGPRLSQGNPCQHNWTMQVQAESTDEGLSAKIFVFHAVPENDPIKGDTFSNVASLQQMNLLPEDAPVYLADAASIENNIPFYRRDSVTFDCYNLEQAEDIWKIIKIDTASLVREYNISRNLKPVEIREYK